MLIPYKASRKVPTCRLTTTGQQLLDSGGVVQTCEAAQLPLAEHRVATFTACRAASRTIKTKETSSCHATAELKDIIPTREEADRFVQTYLRTFQTVFGIIYVPSFRRDYQDFWNDADSVSQEFVIILMAVICIGSASCPEDSASPLRPRVVQWLSFISTYLISSKTPRGLNSIRIHCLHFLACQAASIKSSYSGTSGSTLLQPAMQLGLHIEPTSNSSQLLCPPVELECRRRLWATVLELEAQASMDRGTQLLIDSDDYTCRPPSNVDDASLQSTVPVAPMPMDQYTQCSMQILLTKSLPARLKIARFLNGPQTGDMFQKALDLSSSLSEALEATAALTDAYRMSSRPPTSFQTSVLNLFVQRFMLSLHLPFAPRAKSNLTYYYSQKVCFDMAISLAPLSTPTSSKDEFGCLQLRSSGPFRSVPRQCALYLCSELAQATIAGGPGCLSPPPTSLSTIRATIQRYVELGIARLAEGERSYSCLVLMSCLVRYTDAVRAGSAAPRSLVATELRQMLDRIYAILSTRARAVAPCLYATPQSSTAMIFGDGFDWPHMEACKSGMAEYSNLQEWPEYNYVPLP